MVTNDPSKQTGKSSLNDEELAQPLEEAECASKDSTKVPSGPCLTEHAAKGAPKASEKPVVSADHANGVNDRIEVKLEGQEHPWNWSKSR